MRTAAEALARTFTETWNTQDGPAYGEAYWPDAELVDPTGQVWDGRDAIARMHVDLWKGPAHTTQVSARVRRIRPIGTDAMVLDLDVDVTGFSPPPPGAAVEPAGTVKAHLKHVVEKRAGDWKIAASQNTFVAALPPGPR
ncbi:MAG: SgcJ/EcaC family oxidoreductase [Sphingomicrobium sp.]